MRLVSSFILAGAIAVSACGGGGAGQQGAPGDASALSVTARSTRTLEFQWQPVAAATHYRLFEDVDGEAGSQTERPLADVTADQHGYTRGNVFLPSRVNARYRLQACDGSACVDLARSGIEGIDSGIGYFKASNPAAFDEFGEGLALSPDGLFLAVGAYREDGINEGVDEPPERDADVGADVGAVYVFRRSGSGWVQDAYIKPAVAQKRAWFGYRLALSDEVDGRRTLLVGSPGDSSGGVGVGADPGAEPPQEVSGAAHVFDRDADGRWMQTSYIKPQTPAAGSQFGSALGMSNDGQWLVVGQPHTLDGGSVSVYRRLTDGWAFQQELQGTHTEDGDAFGLSLQLDPGGEVLAVGAPGEDGSTSTGADDNGTEDAGAVHVFQLSLTHHWGEVAYLKAPQPMPFGFFGQRVVLSSGGATIVVAEADDSGVTHGQIHVFRNQGLGWVSETAITSRPVAANDFDARLALSADGSTLAIANPLDNTAGSGLTEPPVNDGQITNSGTVFLYRRDGAGAWSPPILVKAPNNQSDLYFGWSLALSANGDTLAVYGSDNSASSGIGGNPHDQSAQWAGAVYLY